MMEPPKEKLHHLHGSDVLVVASVSGGKDSAAMCLFLQENGIEHRRVFADTGWEAKETYEYIRGPLQDKLGPIDIVQSDVGGMENWIMKKAMFPRRVRRFCTEELKVKTIGKYLVALAESTGRPIVNAIGVRHAESADRAKMMEWDGWAPVGGSCVIWRPIITWAFQDVVGIHARHGLVPNPLYLKGHERVGCYPCIFARKGDIKLIAENAPERINEITEMENRVRVSALARYKRDRAKWLLSPNPEPPVESEKKHKRWSDKKKRLESPFTAPSFFQQRTKHGEKCWPISSVVAWARTDRGGKQFRLTTEDTPDYGCTRWGLCEGHATDANEEGGEG